MPCMEVCHPDVSPVRAITRCINEVVVAFSSNPQPDLVVFRQELLRGPIRVTEIGDDHAEARRCGRFVLHRRLQPTVGRHPDHQTRLVVLVGRPEVDSDRQHKVASNRGIQKMPVVRLDPVVSPLPEIGTAVRLNLQTSSGGLQRPPHRFAVPPQSRMEIKAIEVLVQ